MRKIDRQWWLLITMVAILFLITDYAHARAHGTKTYQSVNLGLKLSALRLDFRAAASEKVYDNGSVTASLQIADEITMRYSYGKREIDGLVTQNFGLYYNFTIID